MQYAVFFIVFILAIWFQLAMIYLISVADEQPWLAPLAALMLLTTAFALALLFARLWAEKGYCILGI